MIGREFIVETDLDVIYDEMHIIARYFHWERATIRNLTPRERRMWTEKIIKHEKSKLPDADY